MSKDSFKQALTAARDGNRVPVMDFVREEPSTAALVSKLHLAPLGTRFTNGGQREPTTPDVSRMKTLSDRTAGSINDAETVMQILPDMDLAKEILISSITSPRDMVTTELVYTAAEGLMAADTGAAMITEIREHFEMVYKIKSQLGDMLRDILFTTGSYVMAVIPENSVDQVINGNGGISLESLRNELSESINRDGSIKNLGLLGPAGKAVPTPEATHPGLSMESFSTYRADFDVDNRIRFQDGTNSIDTFVSVVDNADALKIPSLHRKVREKRITELVRSTSAMRKAATFGMSLESASNFHKLTDREMEASIFKSPQFGFRPIASIKTQDQLNRTSIGNPLVLHLPSESVLPVHVPGNPMEQIGYFVLLDIEGNPVSKATNVDHYRQLSNRFSSQDSFASTMLKKVNAQMNGTFDQSSRQHLDFSSRIFGEMIEQDLISRLRNGAYTNGVAIANQQEVYRIMLSRALAKQHTQLLFLPIELTTYFAFRYTDDGIGKSILEDMKILSSLRAMMLFSNVMSAMKNSIGRTEVTLDLDEDDPDPMKTFEVAIHEFMRTRQQSFPLGMNSPSDLTDWMARAGYEFIPQGNPAMPALKISTQEKNTNYVKPDQDLEDSLRKRHIMGFGLSPETVDSSFNAEFATTVVSNNLLLAKRATHYQERFTPPLTEHHRKVIRNSEGLLKKLHKIVESNFDKIKDDWLKDHAGNVIDVKGEGEDKAALRKRIVSEVVEQFIRGLEVTLPKPNSATLTSQLDALKIYADGLDTGLDAYINSSFLTNDTMGDMSAQIEAWKAIAKSHFVRQYMADNGILTELGALTAQEEDGSPSLDLSLMTSEHVKALMKSMSSFMGMVQPIIKAGNAVMAATGASTEAPATDDSGSTDDGGDGGSDTGDSGLDDFDATPPDLALPGADEAPVEGDTGTDDTATTEESAKADDADKKSDDDKKPEGDNAA